MMNVSFKEDKSLGCKLARGIIEGREVMLMLPQTFMNESGWAVRRYLDYYKLTVGNIVVVSDDTALSFGHLRLRTGGSSGGHNGLKSLETHLGTREFIRLRMGVGSKPEEQPLADYVLSDFSQEENAALGDFVKRGASVLKSLVTEPVTQVMNRVNTKLTL